MTFNEKNFIHEYLHPNLSNFDELALRLYHHQLDHNVILHNYVHLTQSSKRPQTLAEVTFLPIQFFKTHAVKTGSFNDEAVFTSSSTTGITPSKHHVASMALYQQTYLKAFSQAYGNPEQYVFLCLLPNYLERTGSSLVSMAQGLIEASAQQEEGFYLYNFNELQNCLNKPLPSSKQFFLLGVTFALLDFASTYPQPLQQTIVMETGGMKGRGPEKTREEIHTYLKQQLQIQQIHSEYGMTELLSQAYSKGEGRYVCPPWMKVVITDINDPFTKLKIGKAGLINVIDLANIHSCAFIQTQDIGRLHPDGTFEVLGRVDFSESRGCNLMYV